MAPLPSRVSRRPPSSQTSPTAHELQKLQMERRLEEEPLAKTRQRKKGLDITERKRLEKEAEHLASFPRLNPNPVMEVSPSGEFTFLNRATGDVLREAALEDPRVFFPEDMEAILEALREKRQGNFYREVQIKDKFFGENIHVAPQFNAVRIYASDITERKQIEEALKASEERAQEQTVRLRAVLDAAPAIIWIAQDRECRVITGNRASYEFLRVPEGTDMSKSGSAPERLRHYRVFKDGVDLTASEMPIQRAAASGQAIDDYTMEVVFDDGTVRSLFGNISPVFNAEGQPGGAIAAFVDITEPKQAEEALRHSSQRLELLSETASRLLGSDAPQKIVNELSQKVMHYLDCQAFFNYLVDEERQGLHLNAYHGVSEKAAREIEWLNYGVALSGCAARDACPIIAENIPETPDPRTDLARSFGIKACACHPLFSEGRVIGTLSFGTETRTTFTKDELSLMKAVADQVAVALERHRLLQGARQRADELEMRVQERTYELVKTNEDLWRANQLLERVFSSIDLLVAYMDKDFNFIRVNRAYAESDGRVPEFYVGKNHFPLFPNPENETIFRRVVETGEPYVALEKHFEYAENPERGTTYWDWSLHPIRESDGQISGVVLSLVNVTKRKQAEQALKSAARYTRSLIEASPDPLVTISTDGKITDVNKGTELVTGFSREVLIGRDFSEYFTDPEKARKGYQEVFLKGSVRDYPLAIRHASGQVTEVLYNATVYRNEAGKVQGVFAAARDITERKKAEEKLRQNEELLRNILELLPIGVWIADKNGVITYGNPAGQGIWAGYRYVGIDQFREYKGWWLNTGKRIEPEEWAVARAVRQGETTLNEEIEIECFDGSRKCILNSAIPLRNVQNEISGAFIINVDITERRRTEQAIRQTQKMQALGTLAGGIAHDFNNILMSIMVNTELALMDTPEAGPARQVLKDVLQAAGVGQALVKQITTFSRPSENKWHSVPVAPIVKEALKLITASLPGSIRVHSDVETSSLTSKVNPAQLHQILVNLCNNAVHAMKEKRGILEVSLGDTEVDEKMAALHPDLSPGLYVRLTVRDTGHGIDPSIMERIFDPFFTTKKSGEGSGLGLPVVHGIVKGYKGAIFVESCPGQGSTFQVYLPSSSGEAMPSFPGIQISPGQGERLLLVDDEEAVLRGLKAALERLGYRVTAAPSGREALEIFHTTPETFDCVLTDQSMPNLTGTELAKEILKDRPDLPIILITGFSEGVGEKEAKELGIREFIMKPIKTAEIAEVIRKVLKDRRPPTADRRKETE